MQRLNEHRRVLAADLDIGDITGLVAVIERELDALPPLAAQPRQERTDELVVLAERLIGLDGPPRERLAVAIQLLLTRWTDGPHRVEGPEQKHLEQRS